MENSHDRTEVMYKFRERKYGIFNFTSIQIFGLIQNSKIREDSNFTILLRRIDPLYVQIPIGVRIRF